MNRKEYNGWTNYETWLTKLWMDNEKGTYNYWLEETEAIIKHSKDIDTAKYDLAAFIKSHHEELLPELQGFAAGLLNSALSEVNWYEIAESLINDELANKKAEVKK